MINKKLFITMGLSSLIVFGALASMPPEPEKAKNLKVLPKNLTHDQIETIMRKWTRALGVRCNFCHERGNNAADTKKEKEMAREMFKMTAKINSKYFEGKKDSLGMMSESGIACITCHRGSAHPELKELLSAPQGGPGFGRPGAGGPPPQGGAGTPPPPPTK
ncbi:c-type cytochrome [Mucilaginibacter myungsuensis]|uniref:c-type cytochrome n=1 Tax=Mucilaginibacter myungsuensis TaxID=649104 RepID=UPI001D16EB3A|nr:c-type cytochrome [Mucilaginibacter myungsuensis]MDN3600571.1 c-type cytochrome [Mucilaginibacter myungsuensis]